MENNEQLERFFDQMKKQDEQLEIPAFPEVKTRKFSFWIPTGIAASIAIAFMLLKEPNQIAESPAEVVIITLHTDGNGDQHFTIEESSYLETWESPTSYLLTQY